MSKLYECIKGNRSRHIRDCIGSSYQVHGKGFDDWFIKFIDAIAPIFDMPWFYRLWVIQEVALAKQAQLIFGNQSMPMDHFVGAMLGMWSLGKFSHHQRRSNFHALCNLMDIETVKRRKKSLIVPADNQPPDILELLRKTERHLYTGPRDRIYAILSLAANPGFSADYTLNTEDTFKKFAL